MNILFTLLYYDPKDVNLTLPQYLRRVSTLYGLPQELYRLGHHVEVVHLHPERRQFQLEGVTYHFVPAGATWVRLAQLAAPRLRRHPSRVIPAVGGARLIRKLQPDVIHFFGTVLVLNLTILRLVLRSQSPPILLHDHGGTPPRNHWLRLLQRRNLAAVARWLVTAPSAAEGYRGLWPANDRRLVQFPEVSTPFRFQDRETARLSTGMVGEPIYLATGRLDPVKDPFTLLRGFDLIRRRQPGARLYWYYQSETMLPELQAFTGRQSGLEKHVVWGGRLDHEHLQAVYNSADYFLQASRREVAGYALIEAIACGTIPIVSDIPPFRALTNGGLVGRLFAPGDPAALAAAALDHSDLLGQQRALVQYFERYLSDAARAGALAEIYDGLRRTDP